MAAGAPPLCADVRARRGAPTRRARRPARALRSRRAPGGGSTTADSRAALQDVALARAPGAPGGLLLALAGAPGVVLLRAAPEPARDERGQPAAADDDRQGQPAAEHRPRAPPGAGAASARCCTAGPRARSRLRRPARAAPSPRSRRPAWRGSCGCGGCAPAGASRSWSCRRAARLQACGVGASLTFAARGSVPAAHRRCWSRCIRQRWHLRHVLWTRCWC